MMSTLMMPQGSQHCMHLLVSECTESVGSRSRASSTGDDTASENVSFADDENTIRTPVGHQQVVSVARCPSNVSNCCPAANKGGAACVVGEGGGVIRKGSSKSFTVSNYGNVEPEEIDQSSLTCDLCSQEPLSKFDNVNNFLAQPEIVLPDGHSQSDHGTLPTSITNGTLLPEYKPFAGRQSSLMNKRLTKSMHDISIVARSQSNPGCTLSPGGQSNAQSQKSVMSIVSSYLAEVAKRGRMFAQSKQIDRVIEKNGDLNVSFTNIRKRKRRFIADIFTTLMDMKWRYVIAMFVAAFVFSWLLFALMWLAIVLWIHTTGSGTADSGGQNECVIGVTDFTEALLFSIETQHTIGYGTRAITSHCPTAIAVMMIQSVVGVLIQCVMAGLIFAKLSRGKNRAETFIFSKNAVICEQANAQGHGPPKRVLMLRIGDMRRSQLIGARIHVMLLKRRLTAEGVVDLHQMYLKTTTEQDDGFFFLAWPFMVMHVIDEKSPLWGVSALALLQEDMELVAILEGIVAATGMTTQVRTSYLPSEILWAHKITPLMSYKSNSSVGSYKIDYGSFHEVEQDKAMSDLSAEDMHHSFHKTRYAPKHYRSSSPQSRGISAREESIRRHSGGCPPQVSITITGEDNEAYHGS